MGELASTFLKFIFRSGIIIAGVTAFVLMLNFVYAAIRVSLNASVLGDIYGLVNVWLPFNLNSVFAWVVSAASLYITYRLSVISINYISRFTA